MGHDAVGGNEQPAIMVAVLIAAIACALILVMGTGRTDAVTGAPPTRLASCTMASEFTVGLVDEANDIDEAVASSAETDQLQAPMTSAQESCVGSVPRPAARSELSIAGKSIPYTICLLSSTAPVDTAILWWGSDDVTDGSLGYFCGHNPGIFCDVPFLSRGDAVGVVDSAGLGCEYCVVDVFEVSNTTYLEEFLDRILCYGESIVLQTCVEDGARYRIVVAAAF